MRTLLTDYSEGVFQTLNRALNERPHEAPKEDPDAAEPDDRQSRQ